MVQVPAAAKIKFCIYKKKKKILNVSREEKKKKYQNNGKYIFTAETDFCKLLSLITEYKENIYLLTFTDKNKKLLKTNFMS